MHTSTGPTRGSTRIACFPYGVNRCLGESPGLSISEAGLGLWRKRPEFGPGVGQGRIGVELGTFGMEYIATMKPEKLKNRKVAFFYVA